MNGTTLPGPSAREEFHGALEGFLFVIPTVTIFSSIPRGAPHTVPSHEQGSGWGVAPVGKAGGILIYIKIRGPTVDVGTSGQTRIS